MGLTLQVETNSGIELSNAYVKIADNINIIRDAVNRVCYFRIDVYKDLQAKNEGKSTINEISLNTNYGFIYDINDIDNVFVQAYDFLKAQPGFENAIDC